MKQLYINNKRVIIAEDTYFPFTHIISDLENVNVIGIPSSKSITIPRCPQNDEIFGYIAEITRINSDSTDNFIGVSFNQIKKCNYILYNNSEIISEGLILIDNITENEYSITLYDKLIEQIELLEGNPETNEYYLSSCDLIIDSSNNKLAYLSNSTNVYNQNSNTYVKPVICIKDENEDKKTIRCNVKSGSTVTVENITLPIECSGLQLKTIKNYNVNYATSINNIINSINDKYNDIIEVDNSLSTLFNDVNLLCNSPSNEETFVIYDLDPYTNTGMTASFKITTGGGGVIGSQNGHKTIKLNTNFRYTSTHPTSMIGGNVYSSDPNVFNEIYYGGAATGTIFAKYWMKVYLSNGDLKSLPIYYEIDCIKDVNATLNFGGGGWSGVTITNSTTIDLDFFPDFIKESDLGSATYINCQLQNYDPNEPTLLYYLLSTDLSTYYSKFNYQSLLNTSTITEKKLSFRTNDYLSAKNILPKVSIKDFLIQLVKFFNLDLINNNGKLKIQKKDYYITSDNLLIDEISSINVSNITFNKLVLSSYLPENDITKKYKNDYKKTYGEQIINTGYSIKNNAKNINLDITVPILLQDYNSFAYNKYLKYFNGGYCKNNHGLIKGIEKNKLIFGYVKQVNEIIYITDDSPFEGGMSTPTITGTGEVNFVHYNPKLYINSLLPDSSAIKYYITGSTDPTYGVRTLPYYYTFIPYKFSGNTITDSLEINKSVVNYAGISDANYPIETTLYYRFHRNLLIDKYSSNTHILKVKLFIDGIIDIYKIYNYKNSYYIISNIVEYDPTVPGIYEIELMRVNDTNNYINNIII